MISLDIMPTLLGLAAIPKTSEGMPTPPNRNASIEQSEVPEEARLGVEDLDLDGIDLTPALLRQAALPVRPLYWASMSNSGRRSEAMRDGSWKLVVRHPNATPGTFENERLELYDLAQDPSEKSDLAGDFPERAEAMSKRLKLWFEETQRDATPQRGGWLAQKAAAVDSKADESSDSVGTVLIESITKTVMRRNRDGKANTWFHPRACVVPGPKDRQHVLMTLQEISASDYFGPVHWTVSEDSGDNWSEFEQIPALGRVPVEGYEGLEAGVCDVTPQYHSPTDTVLALGHVVFYRGPRFSKSDQLPRYPIYAVRRPDGSWSERKVLKWDDPRGAFIYSNNCGQRLVMPNGDILMAFTFGAEESARSVAGVRCSFDGKELQVVEVGPPLTNEVGRGLLEPSLAEFEGTYFLTIRAEDGHGYVATSPDGIDYVMKPWSWDDGEALSMSTTQQHWLTHSDALFLVYTRRDPSNENVVRWRSPLWVAQVDPDRACLIRETERIVLPLVGNGVSHPDAVALMGNFHVTNVSPLESWVTVGEWMPRREARGDLLISKIQWTRPNLAFGFQR